MNYGLALAFLLIAVAMIVMGWRGTYATAWRMLTGRQTTFGRGPGYAPAFPFGPADRNTADQAAATQQAGVGAPPFPFGPGDPHTADVLGLAP